jgi:hypothetical protein
MIQNELSIAKETTNLLKSEKLLRMPVEEMTDDEALAAWSVIDLIEKKLLKDRKGDLHDHLMELAETKGVTTDKGHKVYTPESCDGSITKQKKSGKASIDTEGLLAMLRERGFDTDKVMTKTVDLEKVEALIVMGEISSLEIKACSDVGKPTYALQVEKPSSVLSLMPVVNKKLKGK